MPTRRAYRRTVQVAVFLCLLACHVMLGQSLAAGQSALMQGRIADAASSLNAAIAANRHDGQAHLLLCRAYYAERAADAAVRECESALESLNQQSAAQDWMGKAYGLKAERAGPISGYNLAKKVKTSFETAVSLDPKSADAIDDLGDYYIQAPAIVGGGISKAKALAARTRAHSPELAFRLDASIAEKESDFGTAERLLRLRVESTKGRPDTWLDLGGYYVRHSQIDMALDAYHHALLSDHNNSSILVAVAEALVQVQREPNLAEKALSAYLSGNNTDDSAPTFKAHVLLGRLLAQRGDKAAARVEFNKALTLAPDYEPAKKAIAAL